MDETTLRHLAAAAALLLYGALCARIWLGERRKLAHMQREAAALRRSAAPADSGRVPSSPLLLAWASQSGQAEDIARQTAHQLHAAGHSVRLCALGQLDAETLASSERALFIVSTTGEGDAPDNAIVFQSRCMQPARARPGLGALRYGLLALGDSSYAQYCGFGRTLDAWLQASGAAPWFARLEMDNGSSAGASALAAWQQQLQQHLDLPAPAPTTPATAEDWRDWTLARREHLNPGSSGEPIWHLELAAATGQAIRETTWESGDLLQLHIPTDPEKPRDYSIASIARDGRVHLMVRLSRRADGQPGLASAWLTGGLALGGHVRARLRAHRNFRLEGNATRPLILIGNGTGLAGLRSHLKARAAAGAVPNWLLFGERHAAHDRLYADELHAWQHSGVLQRLDLAFSRDPGGLPYVQDHLLQAADLLRDWVQQQGAAIYVCGSLQGMAQGVDRALHQLLGEQTMEQLRSSGRYRRDVY